MTKKGDKGFPLPEVRFLVARNWRARFGLAALVLLGLYLLSAVVELSQENKTLNNRNTELQRRNFAIEKNNVRRSEKLLDLIEELSAETANIDRDINQIPIEAKLREILGDELSEAMDGESANSNNSSVPNSPTTGTMRPSIPPSPPSTQTTVNITTTTSTTTTTIRSSTTTTATRPRLPSTTTTTRPCLVQISDLLKVAC